MKQKETLKYIVKILKKFGPLPTSRISDEMFKVCPTDGYDFRWGCQQLKEPNYTGEIIAIDKSVWPNKWYLT